MIQIALHILLGIYVGVALGLLFTYLIGWFRVTCGEDRAVKPITAIFVIAIWPLIAPLMDWEVEKR